MIKMYINNEEVVSNKEFTISEEMLATPSTVLNNCYPALWENTKDYVSKFYFPKDYSKCIIGDGEFEKGSQRNIIKKVSGISPSFETNITKPRESLTTDGNSYQATSTDPVSPSPDYPSEITNITGNIQIVETGKNLWKPFANETRSGITITQNADGSILLNGTATNDVFLKIALNKSFNETMTLGYNYKNGSISNANIYVRTRNADSKLVHNMSLSSLSKKGIGALTMNAEISYQDITVQKGTTLSNVLLEIMLLKGTYNETNLPDYEPYTEEVVNIDLKGNELTKYDKLIIKDSKATIQKKSRHLSLAIKDMNNFEDYPGWQPQPELLKDYPGKNGSFYAASISYMTNISNSVIGPSLNTLGSNGVIFLAKTFYGLTQTQWKEKYPDLVLDLIYELKEPYEIDLGEITLPNTLIGQNNVTLDATLETNMEISYYYSSYDLLFAGVVKKTGNISLNPRYPHYADIQVLDFKT